MIRLLIWAVVAMGLLGIFYKVASRGGIHGEGTRRELAVAAEARAVASGPPATAGSTLPAAVAPTGDERRAIGYGLSFAIVDDPALTTVAQFGCHGDPAPTGRPHRGSCNPYDGDTSCRTVLPVACYRASGDAPPANLPRDTGKGWAHGQFAATQPVMGALLKSEPSASARCEAELGPGWRMAEFHDGGAGWGFQGTRHGSLPSGTRYWIHVNDQHGNCWDSKP